MDFKDIKQTESVLLDAVSLSKSNFINLYVSKGYSQEEVGPAWHDLKKSSKAGKLTDLMNKTRQKSSEGEELEIVKVGGVTATSVVTKEELAEEKKAPKKKKKVVEEQPEVEELEAELTLDLEQEEEEVKAKAKKKVEREVSDAPIVTENGGGRLAQVKALYDGGMMSASAIAKETGINPSYIHTLLKKIKSA